MFGLGELLAKEIEYWATGGQGYQKNQGSVGVVERVEVPTFTSTPSVQQSEPQPQQSESECPPIFVPEKHQVNMDAALDIIYECGKWDDFCKVISQVSYEPDLATTKHNHAFCASHRSNTAEDIGNKFALFVSPDAVKSNPVDLAHAMLHEIKHALIAHAGKPYGGNAEEKACNRYGDEALATKGYKRNYYTPWD